jgi:hypothetical protein
MMRLGPLVRANMNASLVSFLGVVYDLRLENLAGIQIRDGAGDVVQVRDDAGDVITMLDTRYLLAGSPGVGSTAIITGLPTMARIRAGSPLVIYSGALREYRIITRTVVASGGAAIVQITEPITVIGIASIGTPEGFA